MEGGRVSITLKQRREKENRNTFTGYYDENNKFIFMADLLVVAYFASSVNR